MRWPWFGSAWEWASPTFGKEGIGAVTIVKSWVWGGVEAIQNFPMFLEIESPATNCVYMTLEYWTPNMMSVCLPFLPSNSEPKGGRKAWSASCTTLCPEWIIGIPCFIGLCSIALHRCWFCLFVFSNWRQDLPPAKRLWLILLWWSGTKSAISPRYSLTLKSNLKQKQTKKNPNILRLFWTMGHNRGLLGGFLWKPLCL